GPSAHIGLVGGYNTTYAPASASRPQANYQSFGGQAIPRANGFSSMFRGGYGSSDDAFQTGAARSASQFNASGRRYPLFPSSIGLANSAELREASALEQAMSFDQPIMGWESPRVDLPDAPFYVPTSAEITAFHQFLGLTPTLPSQPVPEVMQKEKTYSCLVEE